MQKVEQVFREINQLCGIDIWRDSFRAIAAFNDLAPNLVKESKLLEVFCSCGSSRILINAIKMDPNDQLIEYGKAKQAMLTTSYYSDKVVSEICLAFCSALGMSIDENKRVEQSQSVSNSTSSDKRKKRSWGKWAVFYSLCLSIGFAIGEISSFTEQTNLSFDQAASYFTLTAFGYVYELTNSPEDAVELYALAEDIYTGGFASDHLEKCQRNIQLPSADDPSNVPLWTTTPTTRPSATSTAYPTATPTIRPTTKPTARPTTKPTVRPTPTLSPWTHYPNWSLTDDYCTLRRGDSGTQVRKLQQALVDLGYLSGSIDGKYGAKTEEAVAAFQRNNQIYGSSGIATTLTLAILYNEDVYSAYQTNPSSYANPGNHLSWNPDIGRYEDGRPGVCLWLYNDGDVPITAYVLGYYTETSSGKKVYGDHWYWHWDCEEIDDMVHELQLPISSLPNPDQVDKIYICVEEVYYADGRVYSSYGIPYERECFEYWID